MMVNGGAQRCNGAPVGGEWNKYGSMMSTEKCEEKCAADPSCQYVVHSGKDGGCSKFAACAMKSDDTQAWTVWAKEVGAASVPGRPAALAESPP